MEDIATTRPHLLKLTGLRLLSDRVLALDLQRLRDDALSYREGQFLSINLHNNQRRSYSMASPYDHKGLIELHVRLLPGGLFSEWLRHKAKIGEVLNVYGPFGNCIWREPTSIATRIIMLATGTGIAPLKAMLERALTDNVAQTTDLYWGGQVEADIYLNEYFTDLAYRHQNFRFHPVLTDPAVSWKGRSGFVQTAAAKDHPNLSNAIVYACGALPMVNAARELLTTECQLEADHFLADAFVPAALPVTALDGSSCLRIELEHAGGEQNSLVTVEGISLMHALTGAQLLRGVCGGQAACGTCLVTIASGWVDQLTPPNRNEKRLLASMGNTGVADRLACQIPLHAALNGLRLKLHV